MKAEEPVHHAVSQHMETGVPFITPGCWGQFIAALLDASDTIDRRRAARQAGQVEAAPLLRMDTCKAEGNQADSQTPDLQQDRAA